MQMLLLLTCTSPMCSFILSNNARQSKLVMADDKGKNISRPEKPELMHNACVLLFVC